jgi:hypothetical protein
MEGCTMNHRRLASLALGSALLATSLGVGSAGAYTWSSPSGICNGGYFDYGSLQGRANFTGGSGPCWVKAQVKCQMTDLSSKWIPGPQTNVVGNWSTATCSSPWNYARINVGAIYPA